MAKSVNKVILIGNLGKDPEVKYTPQGTAVAKFSLATNERFKDKQGEWQDRTEWHNITCWARLAEIAGADVARQLESASRALYDAARRHAQSRGIIVADTKFEFGWIDGKLILIDELLTPDSSRFWPADRYEPGRAQPSFDKQPVRDWLEASGWNCMPKIGRLRWTKVCTGQSGVEASDSSSGASFRTCQ